MYPFSTELFLIVEGGAGGGKAGTEVEGALAFQIDGMEDGRH